jgi:hypothetical protein
MPPHGTYLFLDERDRADEPPHPVTCVFYCDDAIIARQIAEALNLDLEFEDRCNVEVLDAVDLGSLWAACDHELEILDGLYEDDPVPWDDELIRVYGLAWEIRRRLEGTWTGDRSHVFRPINQAVEPEEAGLPKPRTLDDFPSERIELVRSAIEELRAEGLGPKLDVIQKMVKFNRKDVSAIRRLLLDSDGTEDLGD